MNYRKMNEQELIERLKQTKEEIAGLEETLDLMPNATVLGRLSIKSFLKKKIKIRNEILSEIHSRKIIE